MVKERLVAFYREKIGKKNIEIEDILKFRDELPQTSYVAMKVRIKQGDEMRINFLI
jgi:hypothetical protein